MTIASFDFLNSCKKLKDLDENGEDSKPSFNFISGKIAQTGINKEDIRCVYDNWDIAKECVKLHEAN